MVNEQKARYLWRDYVIQTQITADLERQNVNADTSLMRLAKKNRKNALNVYLKTLAG